MPLADGLPFPPSHNSQLFDFVATSKGAEWIDQIAWRALEILGHTVGPQVVGHYDWRTGQMVFRRGKIVAVFDWESLRYQAEAVGVGDAMRSFTHRWPVRGRLYPNLDEMLAFIHNYESARGRVLAPAELRLAGASAAHAIAYGARVEHSRAPQLDEWPEGSGRSTLRAFGERLLAL